MSVSDTWLKSRLGIALLTLRLSVGLVFVMWTVDKFLNPEHAAGVYEAFYKLPGLGPAVMYTIGGLQAVVVLMFILGWKRQFSYLVILILHAISTFSSYAKYFDPWTKPNLLFFAAIPMLAACWTLWSLQRYDFMFSVDAWTPKKKPKAE